MRCYNTLFSIYHKPGLSLFFPSSHQDRRHRTRIGETQVGRSVLWTDTTVPTHHDFNNIDSFKQPMVVLLTDDASRVLKLLFFNDTNSFLRTINCEKNSFRSFWGTLSFPQEREKNIRNCFYSWHPFYEHLQAL